MCFVFTSDDLLAKMEELNHFQRLKYQFSPKLCLYLSIFLGSPTSLHMGLAKTFIWVFGKMV